MVKRPAPPPDVAIEVLNELEGNETSLKPDPAVAACAPLKTERFGQVVACCDTGCDVGVPPPAVGVDPPPCSDVVDVPTAQPPSASVKAIRLTRKRDHRGKDGIRMDASCIALPQSPRDQPGSDIPSSRCLPRKRNRGRARQCRGIRKAPAMHR